MIDFHNHVIPNVDDGPNDVKESLSMLQLAHDQGIKEVVQTVHFQHPKMFDKNVDYTYLKKIVDDFQLILNKKNIDITLHLAAEVFYLPNLVEISNNPLLTIGNGKYMLIEFEPNIYPKNYENELFKLQSIGITPIIAHPERYRFVQQDISILDKWIDREYIIQIDAGSIIGKLGRIANKASLEMIDSGYIHLIGSDAHNNKNRNFCLKDAYSFLSKNYSKDLEMFLKTNAQKILLGEEVIMSSPFKKKSNSLFKKRFKFI
tara:strand:- start:36697 stop:37479 length:783 start_codon:yes stop_codon:yes gene_type:complete